MQPKVGIYVTHRIDQDNVIYKDSIYTPIRCGAIFDDSDSNMLGDNIGENISEKRKSYCELTTQYWVWKNIELDYYGFCHYRRYFSFSASTYPQDEWGAVHVARLSEDSLKEFITSTDSLVETISYFDAVFPIPTNLPEVNIMSVYEQYQTGQSLDTTHLDIILEIINNKFPQYAKAAKEYLDEQKLYSYNMFIMKKELFKEYSQFLFTVLFEFERCVDLSKLPEEGLRTPGHLGERILGIFATYLLNENKFKIGYKQVVFFHETKKEQRFLPLATEGNIPIFISSSDYFTPYASVTIQSIIENASTGRYYDIILLQSDISEKNQIKLKRMIGKIDNFSIRFYNIKRAIDGLALATNEYISVETYYRLLIPTLFPEYQKALFLDADTVVLRDVAELYDTDIGDNLLGATADIHALTLVNGNKAEHDNFKQYLLDELHLSDPYQYYQAGVLILNLEQFRKCYTGDQMMQYALSRKYVFLDQDVMNALCTGKVKRLHMKWDVLPNWGIYRRLYAPAADYEEFMEAQKDPYIVHYAGPGKPWDWPENELSEMFWKFAKNSPFYSNILQRFMEATIQRKLEETIVPEPAVANVQETHCYQEPEMDLRATSNSEIRGNKTILNVLLPIGSRRRETVKKIVFKFMGKPYIAPSCMKGRD